MTEKNEGLTENEMQAHFDSWVENKMLYVMSPAQYEEIQIAIKSYAKLRKEREK